MRPFSLAVESVFLHCHYFTDVRKTLFNEYQLVDESTLNHSDNEIVELLLYGNNKFKFQQKCFVLKSSVIVIVKLERFNGSFL